LFPPPFVLDADVLIRNVGYAVRRGHNDSLIAHGRHGYFPSIGIPLYAALSVGEEVERRLPDVARRCGKSLGEVVTTWNEVFLPRLLFVPISGDEIKDDRVDAVRRLDPNDVTTAALAVLLAESVLLTHNYKDFQPLGIPKVEVKEIAVEAQALSGVLRQADAATLLPRAVGYGVHAGAKRVVSALGSEASLVLGLLILGAIVLYWESEPMRRVRAGAAKTIERIGPPIAEALEQGDAASAALWRVTVRPADPVTGLAYAARELAVANTLTTKEIADRLRWNGFQFKGDGEHRTLTRAWLIANDCFYELRRGHWSLGYLLEPMQQP
jgi:hypothetical protein